MLNENKKTVLTVFGTRPEAIKMAPLVKAIENSDKLKSVVCVTAQHRQMLDQVLDLFDIKPDFDLDIMKNNQDLWSLTSEVLLKMKNVFEQVKPDVVLVHGDSTTTMATSLSAFYAKVPVGHVEAGLRTFDKLYPFPEEINRVIADGISDYFFAPTDMSVDNLIKCNTPQTHIYKTGNTVIDALLYTINSNDEILPEGLKLDSSKKMILLTSHRRENFGEPIKEICKSILESIDRNPDIEVVYPVHLNPNVQKPVNELLGNKERIHLIAPQDYVPFCNLMKKSYLILTDSGGVQEEAPALGKPVLVLRDTTERPEAVEYGTVKLVGHDKNKIVNEVEKLLNDENYYKSMSEAINPYGDGKACPRIVEILEKVL